MDDAGPANYGQSILAFCFSARERTFSPGAEIEDERDRKGNKSLKWGFSCTREVRVFMVLIIKYSSSVQLC